MDTDRERSLDSGMLPHPLSCRPPTTSRRRALIAGLAGGAGELFGGNVWLGQAATGAVTLLLLAAALGSGLWLQGRGRLQRLVRRHARLAGEVAVPTGAGSGPC